MLNQSCVQCGIKRLKCDGGTPCGNCVKKKLASSCHHIARKPRSKRNDGEAVSFVASTSPSSANDAESLKPLPIHHDLPFWADSQERLSSASLTPQSDSLLRLARDSLGDASTCEVLIDQIFFWRVSNLSFGCVDSFDIQRDIKLLFKDPSPQLSSGRIVLCMMVIALSWQHLPRDGSIKVGALGPIDGKPTHKTRQKLLHESSLDHIRQQMVAFDDRVLDNELLPQIQTIILILLYDQAGTVLGEQLFDHAQRCAKRLNLHSIASRDTESKEEELKVRAWWCLVTRNWFTSLHTSSYSINPNHFTTRKPASFAALDEHPSRLGQMLKSHVSPLRFGIVLISLADLIRKLVDQRLTDNSPEFGDLVILHFRKFWSDIPQEYFKTSGMSQGRDPTSQIVSRIQTTESWILHQLIFHALLELYPIEPLKPMPESCISLARHILTIQSQVNAYCNVLRSLRVNITNIVKANIVLVIDLIQKGPQNGLISRSVSLTQIHRALEICQSHKSSRPDDFSLLIGMLTLEDHFYTDGPSRSNSDNFLTFSEERNLSNTINNQSTATATANNHPSYLSQLTSDIGVETSSDGSNDPMSWSAYLPSDSGIYPAFQANSVEEEWSNIYEVFLAMSSR